MTGKASSGTLQVPNVRNLAAAPLKPRRICVRPFRCALLVVLLTGCGAADRTTEPNLRRVDRSASMEYEGEQNPPEDAPPEYQGPVTLIVKSSSSYGNGYASATAHVNYAATNVLAKSWVTAAGATEESESERFNWVPVIGDVYETAVKYVGACGSVIEGKGYGKIWMTWMWHEWAKRSDTKFSNAKCPNAPSTSGGGGPSGGEQTCYTWEVDHYEYDPNTGNVEYLYSTSETWCEGQYET